MFGADGPETHIAIHPRSEERGILAFSRNRAQHPRPPKPSDH
jgi:hypothetical protein